MWFMKLCVGYLWTWVEALHLGIKKHACLGVQWPYNFLPMRSVSYDKRAGGIWGGVRGGEFKISR
jgi:hypothetical protein